MIRRRWFYVTLALLGVSLLANLFVAGVWAGRRSGGPSSLMLGGLPREIAREVRAEIRANPAEAAAAFRSWREAQRAARQSLIAEPFDPEEAGRRMKTLREAAERLQAITHGAIIATARDLPAETRAAIPTETRAMRRLGRRLERRFLDR
ncbi:MAG: periplasmic heavy metal sensor [Pseudomonadota bacterium]